jgi:hypothetical protein
VTQHHKSGRGRVVGTIMVGTLVVGCLGGLAGVALDPPPGPPPALVDDSPDVEVAPATSGGSALRTPSSDSETPDPNMVGALHDLGYGPLIYVPTDWEVYRRADTRLWAMNGKGSFGFAAMGQVAPGSVTSGEVLRQNVTGLLPPDEYTQLDVTGPETWGEVPYGEVVSRSVMAYQALWVSDQGSAEIYGQLYAGVRRDGVILVVLIEHVPPNDWDATRFPREAIVSQSMLRFAGLA